MNTALKIVFDAPVVLHILSFVPVDNFEIEALYGFTEIYGAKHYITYGGGPKEGLCISPVRGPERGLVQVAPRLVQKIGLHQDC